MRFAINIPNFGPYADARYVAKLAREAEASGWDGLFVWDHLVGVKEWRLPVGDAWLILAAAAISTERIAIGPMVSPLPRRRPAVVARQAVTLDRLSGGRLILGVGLGEPPEDFTSFGESADRALRAALLDEALDVLVGLWTGEPFTFHGRHFDVDDVTFLPRPAQRPRIPIWIAAQWPGGDGPIRRAARWDGICPIGRLDRGDLTLAPEAIADVLKAVGRHRPEEAGPYDVMAGGSTPGDDPAGAARLTARYAEAGATWWSESPPFGASADDLRARIRQGPPAP